METKYIKWLSSRWPLTMQRQRMITLVYMSCIFLFILTQCCTVVHPSGLCAHITLLVISTWIQSAACGNYHKIDQFETPCWLIYSPYFLHFFWPSISIVTCVLYICALAHNSWRRSPCPVFSFRESTYKIGWGACTKILYDSTLVLMDQDVRCEMYWNVHSCLLYSMVCKMLWLLFVTSAMSYLS